MNIAGIGSSLKNWILAIPLLANWNFTALLIITLVKRKNKSLSRTNGLINSMFVV
jgi:hypothetical protein